MAPVSGFLQASEIRCDKLEGAARSALRHTVLDILNTAQTTAFTAAATWHWKGCRRAYIVSQDASRMQSLSSHFLSIPDFEATEGPRFP